MSELLSRFEGKPVETALAHLSSARTIDTEDEDELIDELTGLVHVARHSDAFGFDLLGWLSPAPDAPPQAMCLEVKSAGSEGFHLSRGEWRVAQKLKAEGQGARYAVLVVRRAKDGGVPVKMDLLVDPVHLVEEGHLRKDDDGYHMVYVTEEDS